ncbi:MAG: SRPBCC family protein [Janthinobacterium lividum]
MLSVAAGLALVFKGLQHPGPTGIAKIALGAGFAWRGYSGVCQLSHKLDQTAYEHFLQKEAGWDNSKAVSRSVTINRPRAEVFAFFLDPGNLSALMPWVQRAEPVDEHSSRWTALGPFDKALSWTIKQNVIRQDQALQWDTAYQGPWKHRIEAIFTDAPHDRGTEVRVVLACEPFPGSAAYALASAIAQFSDKALLNLLRQVKQKLETGEVATNRMYDTFAPGPEATTVEPVADVSKTEDQPQENV